MPVLIPVSTLDPWALGASLYAPATRDDLVQLGTDKYPHLSSLIYCTEDAVREEDVPRALANLTLALPDLPPIVTALSGTGASRTGPLRLIRARNPEVLAQLLTLDLRGISGFVLPKTHDGNLASYMRLLNREEHAHLSVLLTLETREALSEHRMACLRDLIFQESWQHRIACLRIGGNDLMHALGVRRTPGRTLYEGPLERVISMLIGVFKPYGFMLSSPVYEVFEDLTTLAREVQQDLEYGLSGKTIIHPVQLSTVLNGYRVTEGDLQEAHAILAEDAPAVFKMNGRMCEPATHSRWAHDILIRAERYGTLPPLRHEALHF
ncbi:HpcH/HpaI aldolase/citrate lyase family protein [Deinococcus sp. QL22]|uniref:HpcH/HpaI aldolase/citrate lyase family protein n=1 Tax=Deinococcus sp. QL22 TaxID=2939437 RepID=UPI00201824CB|nr:HpcH/HpaI aldolase/citrate lyase family protein [Deinococcus sp. QL22]UQN09882.1 HpcH/HpaI aldolase/citrate lyase family protein [Deinococcus sp. QL22]